MPRFAMFATLMILPVVLGACHSSGSRPEASEPAREDLARATYAGIVENANVLLHGDYLGWFDEADEVERTGVRCKAAICSGGFLRYVRTSSCGVEGVELEFLGSGQGVDLVKETGENDTAVTDVYGGWMEHTFFAVQADLFLHPDDPDQGATRITTYANGYPTPRSLNMYAGFAASSPSLRRRLRTKMRTRLASAPLRELQTRRSSVS